HVWRAIGRPARGWPWAPQATSGDGPGGAAVRVGGSRSCGGSLGRNVRKRVLIDRVMIPAGRTGSQQHRGNPSFNQRSFRPRPSSATLEEGGPRARGREETT